MPTMHEPPLGNLYFLQVDGGGPVKIGWTGASVPFRMQQIQSGSPYVLRWIGACVAPRAAEKTAHLLLAPYRLRAEWFHPVAPVMQFVREKSGDFDAAEYIRREYNVDLQDRMKRITGVDPWALAAQASGLFRWEICAWRTRSRRLPDEAIAKIEAAIAKAEAA